MNNDEMQNVNIQKLICDILYKFERNAAFEEGFAKGYAEGLAEGRVSIEIARRMKQSGMNDSQIHSITNLSFDDIKNL